MSANNAPREIEVVAYSGYKANERPLYFFMQDKRLEVEAIVDRWYGEDHDYYKVLADDGKIYLLGWQRFDDRWFLVKVIEKTGRH